MAYSDPEKQREYQRDWQRMKRAGSNEKVKLSRRTLNPEDIKTAQDIRDLMSEVMAEVWESDVEVLSRARCLGYLAAIALKAVETADLESRLEELEKILKQRKKR